MPGYGPGDQGAYNQQYHETINFLDEKYNAKLYKKYRDDAVIVHFHGPKPQQYVEQLEHDTCSFHTLPSLCVTGMDGFCNYAVKDGYMDDDPVIWQASVKKSCEIKVWNKTRRIR
jgi:hypothetical protein